MKKRCLGLILALGVYGAQAQTPSFTKVITQAYRELLDRDPDPTGLAVYQQAMTNGLTEAALRESLIRSVEYLNKNPGPTPSPTPTPTPGTMTPLRVTGNTFVNGAGPVKLSGMVVCCDDPATDVDEALERGWPLIDNRTLDLLAEHKQNYTIIRLGPSINKDVFGDGELPGLDGYALSGNKYDLNAWNPVFWSKVRTVLQHAREKGIYVNVSVIDSWVLDHELSPWNAARNLQGYEGGTLEVVRGAPSTVQERWIRKVVQETGEFQNVLYLDGNESFKGHVSQAWIHGIRDIVRSELANRGFGARLFSSNSGITENVDFIVLHDQWIPEPGNLPIVVDEYPTRPVDAVLIDAKRGWDWGSVSYAYWRGEHPWSETERCLDGLKLIVEGGDPVPIPASCPTLTKMGVVIFQYLDRHFQPVPRPVVDGFVVLDLTPKFGQPPRPCNAESSTRCGGRPCEPPNGGRWELLEGGSRIKVEGDGFKLKVGPLVLGNHRVRVSPHPDSHDAFGVPHNVSPSAPQEISFTVEP